MNNKKEISKKSSYGLFVTPKVYDKFNLKFDERVNKNIWYEIEYMELPDNKKIKVNKTDIINELIDINFTKEMFKDFDTYETYLLINKNKYINIFELGWVYNKNKNIIEKVEEVE